MRTEVRSFHGRDFNVVVSPSTNTLWTFDDHEPVRDELLKLKPGDLFVDIGAAFGSYTLPALALGALVLAFEPSNDGWEVLNANIDANPGFRERCYPVRKALYDGGPLPEGLAREVFCDHYPAGEVETDSLDKIFYGDDGDDEVDESVPAPFILEQVKLMKLDVEGFELGVLLGARELLEEEGPALIVEDHDGVNPNPACLVSEYPKSIQSSKRVQELLKELGYRVQIVPWGHDRRYILADRPESRPEV